MIVCCSSFKCESETIQKIILISSPGFSLLHRQLRARRALVLFKDVPLRTRRAIILLYKVYDDSALLVFNETSLNSVNAFLALSQHLAYYTGWRRWPIKKRYGILLVICGRHNWYQCIDNVEFQKFLSFQPKQDANE